MRMSDVFKCEVTELDVSVYSNVTVEGLDGNAEDKYAAHAINQHDRLLDEIESLKEEVERLSEFEKDAARYNWLKIYHCGDDAHALNICSQFPGMDDAIDYMMESKDD